jgi:integrase
VCGLRRSDIDLQACTITIYQTVSDLRGKPTISTPKTRAGRRVLPFPRALVPMAEAHLAWLDRRAKKGAQHGQWIPNVLLFPGRGGRNMNTTSLYHQLQRLCVQAHVVRTKVHDLRHTAAACYTSTGAPENIVSAILGHTASSITRHYAPPDVGTLRPWVERVYEVISGEVEKARKTGT